MYYVHTLGEMFYTITWWLTKGNYRNKEYVTDNHRN